MSPPWPTFWCVVHSIGEPCLSLLQETLNALLVVVGLEELVDDLGGNELSFLRRAWSAEHEVLVHGDRDSAAVLCNLGSELNGAWKDSLWLKDLREEVTKEWRGGWVDCSSRDEVHGSRVSDESWEEEVGASLHDETSASKDEANLGLVGDDTDGHWEGHGDSNADSGAVDSANDWLGAAVDVEGGSSSSIAVLSQWAWVVLEPNLQICTSTEHLTVAGHNNCLDSRIGRDQSQCIVDLAGHETGIGIVLPWAVEGENHNRCCCWAALWNMANSDVLVWNRSVRGWDFFWKGHLFSWLSVPRHQSDRVMR